MASMVLFAAVTAIVSYLIGSVPFGFVIGKAVKGIDIRTQGSGNIGATNVTRVVGKWWGKFCFALDFFKGFLPVLAVVLLTKYSCCLDDSYGILPAVASVSAVLGHIYPVWLKFKGGKGVSTAAGSILALCPVAIIAAILLWAVIFFISRYVSLASIFAAVSVPVFAWIFNLFHIGTYCPVPQMILLVFLAVFTIVKHSSNIKRLCNGTENRFERKSKNTESGEENK